MEVAKMEDGPAKSGKYAFSDRKAAEFLAEFGIPFVPQTYIDRQTDVAAAARKFGFPVVVKGVGKNLLHKSDRGLVHLNLSDAGAIETAVKAITAEASGELDGFSIQPHIKGRREFVAGLFRDRQFGPVVMFGIGGVFTEAFADVAFRLAPLTESDAAEMLTEIQGNALLGKFRGEMPADRKMLIQALQGLSRVGESHPEVAEVDINLRSTSE